MKALIINSHKEFQFCFVTAELGLQDSFDDFAPTQTRVTRSSSFPVDPKILHRKISPQHSLDSDDEIANRKVNSSDEVLTNHPGMKDVPLWLKSLRLHKYSNIFADLCYEEMMELTEDFLEKKVSGYDMKFIGNLRPNI